MSGKISEAKLKAQELYINSDGEVIVKIVKEVLNLFKIEIGADDADYSYLRVFNEITAGQIPQVETKLCLEDRDGSCQEFSASSHGRSDEREGASVHRLIKLNLYHIFRENFGYPAAPWGILHGVRPTKIVHRLLGTGLDRDAVVQRLKADYEASDEKAALITDMAIRQLPFLAKTDVKTVSVYVGIPFCLTRCLYCSFPANVLPGEAKLQEFMAVLLKDIEAVKQEIKRYGFKVQNIYVGGGTPTSLPDKYFRQMLNAVYSAYASEALVEFTVEAGRPDSISADKIACMRELGVNRVSVNPQTMQQRTLKRIGRQHSPADIVTMFRAIRESGIPSINMDLILGLPGETAADVESTLQQLMELGPDDITLHALALKRGSILKMNLEDWELPSDEETRRMSQVAMKYMKEYGYQPYYLYRQGYQSGQLENVGCCRPGEEGLYNILIMEERQTILGVGGAATTKVIDPHSGRIRSSFNAKDLIIYLRDIDIYIEKRRALLAEVYGAEEE